MVKPLDPEQAAIVSAYTGYLIGSFNEMHKYAEHLFGTPILSSMFGMEEFTDQLREKAKPDFLALNPD